MLSGAWVELCAPYRTTSGSSLSDITTKAKLQRKKAFLKYQGQKIFIFRWRSSIAENIVHLVAGQKLKEPPSGTKGISLFVVSKFRVEAEW